MGSIVRKVLFATVAAVVLVGLVAAFASAAGKPPTNPNNPVIKFGSPSPADNATVTSGDVTYAFTYNRTPKQTATLTCALTGQPSSSGPCDQAVADPQNPTTGSKSGKSYTGLANGSYTFTVTLTLTGGGVYTATRHVTVTVVHVPVLTVTKDNDADHDGTYSDTETVPAGATYPYTVTYKATISNSSVSAATISTISDDKVAPPLRSASTTDTDCADVIGTSIASGGTVTCYFDQTFASSPPSGQVVNTLSVTLTNNAGSDSKDDTSTVNFESGGFSTPTPTPTGS